MAKTTVVGISIDKQLLKLVDEQAKLTGMGRSEYVAAALRDYLEDKAATVRAFADPHFRSVILQAFSQPGVMKSIAEAMSQDMTSDQLELFEEGMRAGAEKWAGGVVKKPKNQGKSKKK